MANDERKYLRLFDANLNRCREGLRVIEDTARFVLEEEKLYKEIRGIRHRLDLVTRNIYPELLTKRDSVSDPGKTIKEGKRKNIEAVLAANFRRAEESLRVLEEYGRLVSGNAGPLFKQMRFKIYSLEKKTLAKN